MDEMNTAAQETQQEPEAEVTETQQEPETETTEEQPQDINELIATIQKQNDEIAQMKELLNKHFTSSDTPVNTDPIEEYLNSENSITGRLLKKYNLNKEDK